MRTAPASRRASCCPPAHTASTAEFRIISRSTDRITGAASRCARTGLVIGTCMIRHGLRRGPRAVGEPCPALRRRSAAPRSGRPDRDPRPAAQWITSKIGLEDFGGRQLLRPPDRPLGQAVSGVMRADRQDGPAARNGCRQYPARAASGPASSILATTGSTTRSCSPGPDASPCAGLGRSRPSAIRWGSPITSPR